MLPGAITDKQWFCEEEQVAAHYGYQQVYKLPEVYPAMAAARLRNKAIETYGMPGPEPTVLQAREEAAGRKRDGELSLARARGLWGEAVSGLRTGLSATTSFHGVASAVAMGFTLGGLLLDDIGWKGWACLGLAAGLTICCARPAVVTLVFLTRLAHTLGAVAAEARQGCLAAREVNRLRKLRLAEEDHRARIEVFVEQHLVVLLGVYNHHKNLALAVDGVAL
jgi:hypothetical protein